MFQSDVLRPLNYAPKYVVPVKFSDYIDIVKSKQLIKGLNERLKQPASLNQINYIEYLESKVGYVYFDDKVTKDVSKFEASERIGLLRAILDFESHKQPDIFPQTQIPFKDIYSLIIENKIVTNI